MVNIMDYGADIILQYEMYEDRRDHSVLSFHYRATNVQGKYTDGPIDITEEYNENNYNIFVKHKMKDEDKTASISFDSRILLPLERVLEYENDILAREKGDGLSPFRIYRYETASNKTENDFEVVVNYGDKDFGILIDKNNYVSIDGNIAIVNNGETDTVESTYIFFKNGYRYFDMSDESFTVVEILCAGDGITYETLYSDFESNEDHYTVINPYSRPKNVETFVYDNDSDNVINKGWYRIFYDSYGMVCGIWDNNENVDFPILYRKEDTENGVIVSSVYPRFCDDSYLGIPASTTVYVIDEIDYTYDENLVKITRTVVKNADFYRFFDDANREMKENKDIIVVKQVELESN